MSSYRTKTFRPDTGKIEDADWLDDYFGHHQYGVMFSDGAVFRPDGCEQVGPKAAIEIHRLNEALKDVRVNTTEDNVYQIVAHALAKS